MIKSLEEKIKNLETKHAAEIEQLRQEVQSYQ
jgi:hypothetical protein